MLPNSRFRLYVLCPANSFKFKQMNFPFLFSVMLGCLGKICGRSEDPISLQTTRFSRFLEIQSLNCVTPFLIHFHMPFLSLNSLYEFYILLPLILTMSVNTIPVGSSDRTVRGSSPVAQEERSFTNHVSPHGYFSAFNPGFSQWGGSLVGVAYRTTSGDTERKVRANFER